MDPIALIRSQLSECHEHCDPGIRVSELSSDPRCWHVRMTGFDDGSASGSTVRGTSRLGVGDSSWGHHKMGC